MIFPSVIVVDDETCAEREGVGGEEGGDMGRGQERTGQGPG